MGILELRFKQNCAHTSSHQPASSPIMAKIADELVAILRNNSVPQGIIEHLEKSGCTTVKMLANWVDEPKELKAAVLSQCQDFKDDNMALAAVKQSWKEADAINTKALKRGADGMEEVNMDEPLSKFEQDSLDQNFLTLYNWELEPGNRAIDSILGRFRREAVKYSPSMFPAIKMRTMSQSLRNISGKRHKLSDDIQLDITDFALEPDDGNAGSLRARLFQYELMANTWALAGCFKVQWAGKEILYCHWQLATQYVRNLRQRTEHLVDQGISEASVINFLVTCEETIRGFAIENTRLKNNPMPWGTSLITAMREHAYVWQDKRDLLGRRGAMASSIEYTAQKNTSGGGGGVASGAASVEQSTVQLTGKGQKICKAYNDRRGCKAKCPHGHVHGCDIRITRTKQACALPHPRSKHNAAQHGTPMRRDA